ncbi:armadillo repeat-containing protein [Anaeramoeba flamelloides]|uniref:Armadillo repeat-containing protein n=1 Tax=Anaeramoeba flamelloides TaxID=1746091 RepID=A0AAV7YD14_9EUKA|nr:armadillo repeat-containing protein [Anaeramoeba flamelloides]
MNKKTDLTTIMKSIFNSEQLDKLKLVGIGSASLGISFLMYKQLKSINFGNEGKDLVECLSLENHNKKLLTNTYYKVYKTLTDLSNPLQENVKTRLFLQNIQKLDFDPINPKILTVLTSNAVYASKFIERNGIETIFTILKNNNPKKKQTFNKSLLSNNLELLLQILEKRPLECIKKIELVNGIEELSEYLISKTTPIKMHILILKCLTWCCEYSKNVIQILKKQPIFEKIRQFLDSKNMIIVEYCLSLISDFENCIDLYPTFEELGIIEKIIEILTHEERKKENQNLNENENKREIENENENKKDNKTLTEDINEKEKENKTLNEEIKDKEKENKTLNKNYNKEKILCNSCLAICSIMVDPGYCNYILLNYDILPTIKNKFISSNNDNLIYCGLKIIEKISTGSISNKILIRESNFFPLFAKLLSNKNSKSKDITVQLITTVKELTTQSSKTDNIKHLFQDGVLSQLVGLIGETKDVQDFNNLLTIVGNSSCTYENFRVEMLKLNILPFLIDLMKKTKNQNIIRNLCITMANLCQSVELHKALFLVGGIQEMVKHLNTRDHQTLNAILVALNNICIYGSANKNEWYQIQNYLFSLNMISDLKRIGRSSDKRIQVLVMNVLRILLPENNDY